jgi:hypothetical protein
MKLNILFFISILFLLSTAVFADSIDNIFTKRLLERHGLNNQEATVSIVNELGADLQALQKYELGSLISFANQYDLIRQGFSYENNPAVYKVLSDGEVLFYSFAIDISKDKIKMTRRFYEVSIRVDGAPYISRVVNYDY